MSLPKFEQCPKKIQARWDTIVSIYRKLFGERIPHTKQYWTMCGPCSHGFDVPRGAEVKQMVNSGLISVKQFHGVDINRETIAHNKIVVPEANWYHDDIYRAMNKKFGRGELNPAIVYADFISMAKRSVAKSSELLSLLDELDTRRILFVCNVMLTNPYGAGGKFPQMPQNVDDILDEFENNNMFQFTWSEKKWEIYPDYYLYEGTGKKSRTWMATVIFYKP